MKKRIITILLSIAVTTTLLTGCGASEKQPSEKQYSDTEDLTQTTYESCVGGYFTVIKEWGKFGKYKIVYANDTKVMYFLSESTTYRFGITPLYNSDRTLQVYEEGE